MSQGSRAAANTERCEQDLVCPFPALHRGPWRPVVRNRCRHHRRRDALSGSTAVGAWNLSAQQISFIVAAVLLGSVLSSLFAGACCPTFSASNHHVLERPTVRRQHSDDRAGQRLRAVFAGASVPGHQRRAGRRRGAAVLGGMSAGEEPRQRHRHLSVAADHGLRRGRADRPILCPSGRERGGRHQRRRRRRSAGAGRQGSRLAQHLLDVHYPGHYVHHRRPDDRRIVAMAVSPRQEGRGAGRVAPHSHRRGGRSRTSRDGRNRPCRAPEGPGRQRSTAATHY